MFPSSQDMLWLNVANAALGAATLLFLLVVVAAVVAEIADKARHSK